MASSLFATSATAQYMLNGLVGCLGDRPGESQAQSGARALDISTSVMAFLPRDPVEMMLAGLAVTHAQLIQDTAREVVCGQDNVLSTRTKSTMAALDRAMLGFLRELRVARKRLIEDWTVTGEPPMQNAQKLAKPDSGTEVRRTEAVKPQAAAGKPPPAGFKSNTILPGLPSEKRAMPEPLSPLPCRSDTSMAALMVGAPPLTMPRSLPAVAAKRGTVAQTGDKLRAPWQLDRIAQRARTA
jgi:hypothetical protein